MQASMCLHALAVLPYCICCGCRANSAILSIIGWQGQLSVKQLKLCFHAARAVNVFVGFNAMAYPSLSL